MRKLVAPSTTFQERPRHAARPESAQSREETDRMASSSCRWHTDAAFTTPLRTQSRGQPQPMSGHPDRKPSRDAHRFTP